jgi:hypothetical protein
MALCLHCLHEARVAARERRNRTIMRFGVWTLSLAVIGVVGSAGVNAATRHPEAPPHSRRVAPRASVAHADSAPAPAAAPAIQQGTPTPALQPVRDTTTTQLARPAAAATLTTVGVATPDSVTPTISAIGPIVGQGRTDLADSVYITRSGDVVVVHFDTSPSRTRRADKFESIVRQTLRSVYGPIADTLLAPVPSGHLVAPNELVTSLPSRGIHLTGPHGARIALWPETRLGRDGPLAIAYRTTVEH